MRPPSLPRPATGCAWCARPREGAVIGGWIAIDDVPEAELPEWARQGTGDRVVLSEQGIAHVMGGRGSVARWSDVLGVAVDEGDAYVLVPRQAPSPPWFVITREMLPPEAREDGVQGLVRAVEARRGQAGYRDAQTVRKPVRIGELERRIRAREEIPGAVEVPTRLQIVPWSAAKAGVALATLFVGGFLIPFGLVFVVALAATPRGGDPGPLLTCFFYAAFLGGIVGSVLVMKRIWKRMDARALADTPKPRMLVMTPDGCMLALEGGARAFSWAEVGSFEWSGDPSTQEKAGRSWLVVDAPDGSALGAIDGAWFGAPLPLIVAVANAYRART